MVFSFPGVTDRGSTTEVVLFLKNEGSFFLRHNNFLLPLWTVMVEFDHHYESAVWPEGGPKWALAFASGVEHYPPMPSRASAEQNRRRRKYGLDVVAHLQPQIPPWLSLLATTTKFYRCCHGDWRVTTISGCENGFDSNGENSVVTTNKWALRWLWGSCTR